MKTLIISFTGIALILSLSNCEHGRDRDRHDHRGHDYDRGATTTTTTTEETTISRPSATLETRVQRSY